VYESGSSNDNGGNGDLASRLVELLRAPHAGLVTDIDGTISPIVARPEEARVVPAARTALEGLVHHLKLVAVVTGRSVDDARSMVAIDGLTYVGNHGMEIFQHGRAEIVPEARPWVAPLAALLQDVLAALAPTERTGLIVENKRVTASLHYRLAPDPDRTRQRLLEILAGTTAASGIRVEEGRRVINLLPPLMISKGSALSRIVRDHALDRVAYLGDDVTDAHAFRAMHSLRQSGEATTLSIGVVGSETPPIVRQLADAAVPSATAVAALLCKLLEGLEASDTMRRRAPSIGSD